MSLGFYDPMCGLLDRLDWDMNKKDSAACCAVGLCEDTLENTNFESVTARSHRAIGGQRAKHAELN